MTPVLKDTPPASSRADRPSTPRRVLVVDDNRDIADTMVTLLKTEHHNAIACYDGGHVIDCVRTHDPDVVVLDIALPNKSGWQLSEEIRQRFTPGRPMIIGVSGEHIRDSDRMLAKMRGFDYYLVKPADPDVLLTLVSLARGRDR